MTTRQEKTLDELASEKVIARGRCQIAFNGEPCSGPLDPCHIIGRKYLNTRWNLENILCGCRSHHRYYTEHNHEWVRIINKEFDSRYAKMWRLAWNFGKPARMDFKEVKKYLKENYERVES